MCRAGEPEVEEEFDESASGNGGHRVFAPGGIPHGANVGYPLAVPHGVQLGCEVYCIMGFPSIGVLDSHGVFLVCIGFLRYPIRLTSRDSTACKSTTHDTTNRDLRPHWDMVLSLWELFVGFSFT